MCRAVIYISYICSKPSNIDFPNSFLRESYRRGVVLAQIDHVIYIVEEIKYRKGGTECHLYRSVFSGSLFESNHFSYHVWQYGLWCWSALHPPLNSRVGEKEWIARHVVHVLVPSYLWESRKCFLSVYPEIFSFSGLWLGDHMVVYVVSYHIQPDGPPHPVSWPISLSLCPSLFSSIFQLGKGRSYYCIIHTELWFGVLQCPLSPQPFHRCTCYFDDVVWPFPFLFFLIMSYVRFRACQGACPRLCVMVRVRLIHIQLYACITFFLLPTCPFLHMWLTHLCEPQSRDISIWTRPSSWNLVIPDLISFLNPSKESLGRDSRKKWGVFVLSCHGMQLVCSGESFVREKKSRYIYMFI